jgi:folate-binding protein YgfZ
MGIDTMMTASEFEAITIHAGLVDRSDRIRLEISGPDRVKFLHNLTTNDIKRLAVGRGCEAFVTSPQGKTIGYLILLAADDKVIARADPGGDALALPHFRKYGVFDDVSIDDRSSSTFELHVFGPRAAELARHVAGRLPDDEYSHVLTEIAGNPVRLVHESPSMRGGLTVIGERPAARNVKESLLDQGRDIGLIEVDVPCFEIFRIEAGTPVFGKEVTEKNLPQEFDRDDRAINFVKGCYLGQETVARIDALGHVNQVLKGFLFEPGSPCPQPGSTLEHDGKRVGAITSSAFSPLRNAAIGLGLVRTTHAEAGTRLNVMHPEGTAPTEAIVCDLPITPRS